jgi:hypothetical protein
MPLVTQLPVCIDPLVTVVGEKRSRRTAHADLYELRAGRIPTDRRHAGCIAASSPDGVRACSERGAIRGSRHSRRGVERSIDSVREETARRGISGASKGQI